MQFQKWCGSFVWRTPFNPHPPPFSFKLEKRSYWRITATAAKLLFFLKSSRHFLKIMVKFTVRVLKTHWFSFFTISQSLANYLKYLDSNPMEYAKYHAWRLDYGVHAEYVHTPGPMHAFCKLCAAIHDKDKFEKSSWHEDPHNRTKECSFKRWDFSHGKF